MEENRLYQVIEELISKRDEVIRAANDKSVKVSEPDRVSINNTRDKLVRILDSTIEQIRSASYNNDDKLEDMLDTVTTKALEATELAKDKFRHYNEIRSVADEFDRFMEEERLEMAVENEETIDRFFDGVKHVVKFTRKETVKAGEKLNEYLAKDEVKEYQEKASRLFRKFSGEAQHMLKDLNKSIRNRVKKNPDDKLQEYLKTEDELMVDNDTELQDKVNHL